MKQTTRKSGTQTLFLSVLMSAPGPLIIGAGLLVGRSATQIADFVRRSAELLGIIASYIVYRMPAGDPAFDTERRRQLERRSACFVGAMMCLGGAIMLLLAILSENTDKGNVIPGLVIALLGVIANTLFWLKYRRLNRTEPNAILAVQARLYRAKSLVDFCVTAALLTVLAAPASPAAYWVDRIGSAIVALYLIRCGVMTFTEQRPAVSDAGKEPLP